MTDSNPFSKFWTKWDKKATGNGDAELCGWDSIEFNLDEWRNFKQEFAELCEQQAKKAEKEGKKELTKAARLSENGKIMQHALKFLFHAFSEDGKVDAFRLVKPQLPTTTKTVKISNSKKV